MTNGEFHADAIRGIVAETERNTIYRVLEIIEKEICEFADSVCKDIPQKDEESIRVLIAMVITRCKDAAMALKGGE